MRRKRGPAGILLLGLAGCTGSLSYYGPDEPATPGPDGPGPASPGTTGSPGTDPPGSPGGTDPTGNPTDPPSPPATGDTGEPPPPPWTHDDPAVPPPYAVPPANELPGDCASVGGVAADLDDDSIKVESFDEPIEVGTLTAPVRGWYELYDTTMAREGDGEWNESAIVRIANATEWVGASVVANCEADWVTVDADNYVDPGGTLFYLGTFWFEAGDNVVELEHVCPRIREGRCTEHEFLEDDDTTCAADDGNSAHLSRDGLCLVVPAPAGR